MKSSPSIFYQIIQEVSLVLISMSSLDSRSSSQGTQSVTSLFRKLGWDLPDIKEYEEKMFGIKYLANELKAFVSNLENVEEKPEKLIDYLSLIGKVTEKINSLKWESIPPSLPPNINELPKRLLDHLTIGYLASYHPKLFSYLLILGVIEISRKSADENLYQPAFTLRQIRYDRLPLLLRSPKDWAESVYQWKTDFDTAKLLSRFETILRSFYLPGGLYKQDSKLSVALGNGPNPIYELRIPFFRVGTWPAEYKEFGLTLSPVNLGEKGIAILPYSIGDIQSSLAQNQKYSIDLEISGNLSNGLGIILTPEKGLEIISDFYTSPSGNDDYQLSLNYTNRKRDQSRIFLFGGNDSSGLSLKEISTKVFALKKGVETDIGLEFSIEEITITIQRSEGDGFIQSILPADPIESKINLGLGFSYSKGLYINGGGGLERSFPIHTQFGPIKLNDLILGVFLQDGIITLGAGVGISAQIGPVTVVVDKLGLEVDLSFPNKGGNLGPLNINLGFKGPTGIGLSVKSSIAKGGGYLRFVSPIQQYEGVFELEIREQFQITAIGIVATQLRDNSEGYSMLIILTASFIPAIEIGLNFKLSRVGGLIGVHRQMNQDYLQDGIKTGALNHILFPEDPIANASRIINNLETAFPANKGRYTFGPMAEIVWSTPPIVAAKVGLFFELPSPVRLVILGTLKASLPSIDANTQKLIVLNMDVFGIFDFAAKKFALDATIYDSRILAYPIQGDMAMRLKWGGRPNMILSFGGFHPAFRTPTGMPALRRLAMKMGSNPSFSLEAYLAITSNTVQFGAKAALKYKKGKVRASGEIRLDVLFTFNPFSFIIELHASVKVKVRYRIFRKRKTKTLAAISVDLMLSGPTPWRAKGYGRFRVCRIRFKVRFDKKWGKRPPAYLPPRDPWEALKKALEDQGNWSGVLETEAIGFIKLEVRDKTSVGIPVHPFGRIKISQKVIPFRIELQKYGNGPIEGLVNYEIEHIVLKGQEGGLPFDYLREYFAMGQFLDISESQKLSRPSFEQADAGITFTPGKSIEVGESDTFLVEYEVKVIDKDGIIQKQPPEEVQDANRLAWDRGRAFMNGGAMFVRLMETAGFANEAVRRDLHVKDESFTVVDKSTLQRIGSSERPAEPLSYTEAEQALKAGKTEGMIVRSFEVAEGTSSVQKKTVSQSMIPIVSQKAVQQEGELNTRYHFHAYIRRGIYNYIGMQANSAAPQLEVLLTIKGKTALSKGLDILGPGHFYRPIPPEAIARVMPKEHTGNFLPNHFPFIEFTQPDFPWAISIDPLSKKLKPWVCLVVLKAPDAEGEGEYTEETRNLGNVFPFLTLETGVLPNLENSWAWAHTSTVDGVESLSGEVIKDVVDRGADKITSRIICPRRLLPNTSYCAFLVPTFKVGVLTGLGQRIEEFTTEPAWIGNGSSQERLPYYYKWEFRTGLKGDFEYLASLLENKVLETAVGEMEVDISKSGLQTGGVTQTIKVNGALRNEIQDPRPWPQGLNERTFKQLLQNHLNLPETLLEVPVEEEAVLTAPIYGKSHAGIRKLEEVPDEQNKWVSELNLDPRYRIAAGLGVQVVQEQQEKLAEEAWNQIGEIEEVNEQLRLAQLAKATSQKIYENKLGASNPNNDASFIQQSGPMHDKIPFKTSEDKASTVSQHLSQSAIPAGVFDPAFNKIVRAGGPVRRRQGTSDQSGYLEAIITGLNDGTIRGAGPPPHPDGLNTMDGLAENLKPKWAKGFLWKILKVLPIIIFFLFIIVTGLLIANLAGVKFFLARTTLVWIFVICLIILLLLIRFIIPAKAMEKLAQTLKSPKEFANIRWPEHVNPPEGVTAEQFKDFLTAVFEAITPEIKEEKKEPIDLKKVSDAIKEVVDPERSISKSTNERIDGVEIDEDLEEILAVPSFNRPMYKELLELNKQFFLPGIDQIPQNSVIALTSNQVFIEAFMAGLNVELGKELLWRGFPTDLKGTYFQHFWDKTDQVSIEDGQQPLGDIKEMIEWKTLGENRPDKLATGNVFLLIRGDLLNRYPNTMVSMIKGIKGKEGKPRPFFEGYRDQTNIKQPIIRGQVDPDITFLGFNISRSEAVGEDGAAGWYFLIEERVGELQFGLDEPLSTADENKSNTDNLDWGKVDKEDNGYINFNLDTSAGWSTSSAAVASATAQKPNRIAIHADDFLPKEK